MIIKYAKRSKGDNVEALINIEKLLARGMQYRRPTGILGGIVGRRMMQQHEPENAWTVSLLDVQPSDAILEIGFGPGGTIERLARLATNGQIAGIDFSRTMVNMAQRRNAAAIKAGRVKLHYGDVAKLPFADGMFDKIVSIHSLYFWPDPPCALAEIQRVLKPSGTLVLTFLPRERWPGGGSGTELCRIYSPEDVLELLEQVGFTSLRSERGPIPEQFREIAVVGRK